MGEWCNWLFFGLGMCVAHAYNWIAWRKYYEGRDGRKCRTGNNDQVRRNA